MSCASQDKFMLDALPLNQIVQGDCHEVMKGLATECVDLIVTDPPYGYSFMGKDWDKTVPSVEVWRECLRILKSGAFAFVMSSPRQDVLSQMIVRLGQAGFNTGFTSIYWVYASGFPKAMNISKAVDKKLGFERDRQEVHNRTNKDGVNSWRVLKGRSDNQFSIPNDVSISKEAKVLDGSYGGFQPKPAIEIIIVCMKPLSEKTFVDQALTNGHGVTWLGNARIPFQNEADKAKAATELINNNPSGERPYIGYDLVGGTAFKPNPISEQGRFPANLLVSDDVLNDGTTSKSSGGSGEATRLSHDKIRLGYGFKSTEESKIEMAGLGGYGDSGSFSRYFDLDKWFSKTIESLPEGVRKTFPFLICPKASKLERNQGCENLPEKETSYMSNANGTGETWHPIDDKTGKERDRFKVVSKNFHPTVKPLRLMSYLVTLGSRPKDVVLDPFCGSGTTLLASEILNRKWIGIDNNPEYCLIARKRLSTVPEKLDSFMKIEKGCVN